MNDTIYVASPSRQQIQVRFNESSTPDRVLLTGANSSCALFATIDGDIFVDNGVGNGRVDRWTQIFNISITAMRVNESCRGLFVDTYSRLYCSLSGSARVIRNSFLGNINLPEMVAGNGTPGSTADMLNEPRGIFVDLKMSLYVADCGNDRVQRFRRGDRNGTTIVGNGSSGTIDLNCPVGIILDGNGYLFIADSLNDRIVGQGSNGFRCIIGCGSGTSALDSPTTIHFDSHANLLVMDSGNGRLMKFLFVNNSCGKSVDLRLKNEIER